MTLIGIIMALLIERALSHVNEWREQAGYRRYVHWLASSFKSEWLWQTPFGLAVLTGLPLLVAGMVQAGLEEGFFELVGLLWAVLVLVLCLGPRDLSEEVHALIEAEHRGDQEAADRIRQDLGVDQWSEAEGACQPTMTAVLVQGHERLLAVLFWFFLLGPLGAILYRLAANLPRHLPAVDCGDDLREAATRLHALLAWAPARITAGLYMLAGNTDDALSGWGEAQQAEVGDWSQTTWRILGLVGCRATLGETGETERESEEDDLLEALGLVRRALLLALGVLAAFTLGGWMV